MIWRESPLVLHHAGQRHVGKLPDDLALKGEQVRREHIRRQVGVRSHHTRKAPGLPWDGHGQFEWPVGSRANAFTGHISHRAGIDSVGPALERINAHQARRETQVRGGVACHVVRQVLAFEGHFGGAVRREFHGFEDQFFLQLVRVAGLKSAPRKPHIEVECDLQTQRIRIPHRLSDLFAYGWVGDLPFGGSQAGGEQRVRGLGCRLLQKGSIALRLERRIVPEPRTNDRRPSVTPGPHWHFRRTHRRAENRDRKRRDASHSFVPLSICLFAGCEVMGMVGLWRVVLIHWSIVNSAR